MAQRPMLASHSQDPLARVQHLLAERLPKYAAVAEYEFDTTNFATSDAVAAHILTILRLPLVT